MNIAQRLIAKTTGNIWIKADRAVTAEDIWGEEIALAMGVRRRSGHLLPVTAEADAPTPILHVFEDGETWAVDHALAGEYGEQVRDLFGTYVIPTPFGVSIPAAEVVATITANNPGFAVRVGPASRCA